MWDWGQKYVETCLHTHFTCSEHAAWKCGWHMLCTTRYYWSYNLLMSYHQSFCNPVRSTLEHKTWCNVDHHNRVALFLQATCSTLKHALQACKMLQKEYCALVALPVCLRPERSTPCAGDCYNTAPTRQTVLWTSSRSTRKGEAQVLPSWNRVWNSLIILASCFHL
jgi:hypothetical protein